MKWFNLLIVLILFNDVKAQKVPNQVSATMDTLTSPGDSIVWSKHFSIYQAVNYSKGGEIHSYSITPDGVLLTVASRIDSNLIPENIEKYIFTFFPSMKISASYLVKEYPLGKNFFRIDIGKAEVLFDCNGNFLDCRSKHDEFDESI